MTPEVFEVLFKIAVGIAGFLGGWVLNNLTKRIESLQSADAELTKKVNSIEVLVAGEYVKREDFNNISRELFAKLDKIYDRLDGKADK